MAEETITTESGLRLRRRTWKSETEVRGTVAIAHGYGEYAARYAWLAAQLNAAGYTVESIDARGHGESEGTRVSIHSVDELVRDFAGLCDRILRDIDTPLFLLGHSLGSLVAIQTALARQDCIAGIILSGNALDGRRNLPAAAIPVLHLVSRLFPQLRLLPALNAPDISTDPSVVHAYEYDPLVDRGRWRLMTGSAVMKAIKSCREALPAIRVPLYLIHGEQDRMLSADGAKFAMQQAGSADRKLMIYADEYHEPLSGLRKDEVVADLIEWLDAHTRRPN